MIFGIRLSVAPVGEQADNLEAVRRAAAYQDGHGHVLAKVFGVADSEIHGVRWVTCSLHRIP
jgi:hypothetical protein